MLLVVLVVVVSVVQTTLGQCLTPHDNDPHKQTHSLDDLRQSKLDFSVNLFKAVASASPSDNVFMSPLSVYNAMLLAYFSSNRHTEASLRKALLLPPNTDKSEMFYAYREQRLLIFLGAYKSKVISANRLFISRNQTLRDCMENILGDEIQMVDFTSRGLQRTVDNINKWVAEVTNNSIQDLVSPDSVNPSTQMILANAAYFRGEWKNQFDARDTKQDKFFVSKSKTVSVPMMYQMNLFNHWRSDLLEAEVLEMPYKEGDISLILLLPDPSNKPYPAAALVSKLTSDVLLNVVKESIDSLNEDRVEIKLPKFVMEKTLELVPILEGLGVGDLFQTTSDLTGLTGGPRIQFSSAIHKAKIQVDEKGTEAAAATAITDTRITAGTFFCDRPFVYLLYDRQRKYVVFAGIYNDPTK